MADITLLGAQYTDVPAVTLPKTGGGTVIFYENGGGIDLPTFTVTLNSTFSAISSISCDKTFTEVYNRAYAGEPTALVLMQNSSRSEYCSASVVSVSGNAVQYFVYLGTSGSFDIIYASDGTISSLMPSTNYKTLNITANGTYQPASSFDIITDVNVNVPKPWTHILTQDVTVSTTSTTDATAATIACGSAIATKDKIIWVHIRDKAGPRAGHCYGSDAYFMNYNKANGSTSAFAVPAVLCIRYTTASAFAGTAGQYGVYGYSISNTGSIIVRRRYNSNYSLTIDGTFSVSVYTLDLPDDLKLFP